MRPRRRLRESALMAASISATGPATVTGAVSAGDDIEVTATTGAVAAGALLAVPLLAVLNSGIRSLLSEADEHVDPEDVHTSEPEETGPDEPDLQRQRDLTS